MNLVYIIPSLRAVCFSSKLSPDGRILNFLNETTWHLFIMSTFELFVLLFESAMYLGLCSFFYKGIFHSLLTPYTKYFVTKTTDNVCGQGERGEGGGCCFQPPFPHPVFIQDLECNLESVVP